MSLKAQARKRLLILLGIVLLIGAGGGGAFYYRNQRMQQRYADIYRRGMQAVADGNDAAVVNFLGQYLRRFPSNVQALRLYAKSRPKVPEPNGQHLLDTANVLHHLLQIDPSNVDDWRQLMKLYSEAHMNTEANEAAQELLNLVPNDGEALGMQASVLVQLHDYKTAEQKARIRLAKAPDDWTTQINRILALSQLQQFDAIQVVIDAMDKYPHEQGALLVQAIGYLALNDHDNTKNYSDLAYAKLMDAAKLPCKELTVAFLLVRHLDGIGEHDASLGVIKNVVASTNDVNARRVLVGRYWEDGDLKDVVAICAAPTSQPTATTDADNILSDTETLGMYADALRRLHNDSAAAAARAQLTARQADPVDGLLATAWNLVEMTPSHPTQDEAKALRAACAQASQHYPRDPYLLYFQGAAYAATGDNGQACALWKKSADQSLTWSLPLIEEARTLVQEGRLPLAEDPALRAYFRSKYSIDVAILNATISYRLWESRGKDPQLVKKISNLIDEIQASDPGEELTLIMRISLLAETGKTADAIYNLRAILQRRQSISAICMLGLTDDAIDKLRAILQPPVTASCLLRLADVSTQWKLGLENECLKTLEDHYGRSPESAYAIAMNDWSNQRGDEGLKLLKDAANSAKGDQAVQYQLALVDYLEASGNPTAAAQWVILGDAYPNDPSVQRGALGSQLTYGNKDFFQRTIERAHTLFGDDATNWKLAQARWDLQYGGSTSTTDAVAKLQDVLQADPDSLQGHLLMATAKSRGGDIAAATSEIQKAQKLDPNSPAIALDMARLLQNGGSFEEAEKELDAVKDNATPDQQMQTAALYDTQGDVNQALKIVESLAARPDASRTVKLYLASLYAKTKQFDKAQSICDELMKTPDPQVIVEAAELDMFQRRPAEANKVLSRLNDLNLPPGQVEQAMGDFRYIFGQLAEAQDFYQKATQKSPNNALCWLSLMDTQCLMGNPAAAIATAKDALTHVPDNQQILAVLKQGDNMTRIGDGETQKRLLSAWVKAPRPDGPAGVTLSKLAELVSGNDSADEVLQGLQKLSQDEPGFLPAQTALIEAQLRLGRSEDAVQSATRAVAAFPNETQPVELAVAALQSLNRWEEALQMAQTWRNRLIGDTLNVDMKIAEIDLHLHQADQAIAAVQPHVGAPFVTADQNWKLLLIKAQALVVQAKPADAVQLLWTPAQASTSNEIDWMHFVINVLPADQADPWLHKMADYLTTQPNSGSSLSNLAGTWDTLAQLSPINKDKYAQSARTLIHQIEQRPDAPPMAFYLEGNFDAEDKDFTGAEAAYRKAAALHVPQAENNLAMLLSDHGGDLAEAIKMAQQCVTDAPQADMQDLHYKAAFYDTLATLLDRNKNYPGAAQALHNAMQLEPNNAKWNVNLIKVLVDDHKLDEAKKNIAVVDLMTPGVSDLPDYKDKLDKLRQQVNAVSSTH
jgi:predicted Zn-dependent protease